VALLAAPVAVLPAWDRVLVAVSVALLAFSLMPVEEEPVTLPEPPDTTP
jgi:hypothetical protein